MTERRWEGRGTAALSRAALFGVYEFVGGRPDLFGSRGLGTSLVPIRLGAPRELAIVDPVPRG